jgi:hypothetical protein
MNLGSEQDRPVETTTASADSLRDVTAPSATSSVVSPAHSLDSTLPAMRRHEDSSFNWIIPGKIAIGNFVAAKDIVLLKEEGIRSVFGLTDELIKTRPGDLGLDKIVVRPMLDGPGNSAAMFSGMVNDLIKLAKEHSPVMVHCHAGRSRSVTLVAGYLMRTEGYSSDVALRKVQRERESRLQAGLKPLLAELRR